jgi:uncharacterized protein
MSWNGHLVVDADSHVYERADTTYQDYMDPEYRETYDLLCRAIKQQEDLGLRYALFETRHAVVDYFDAGRPMGVYDTFGLTPQGGGGAPRTARPDREAAPLEVNWDARLRAEAMDRAGVDLDVIFPSHASSYCAFRDVGFESALYRAYHRFVSQYCAQGAGRNTWIVLPNLRDIRTAVEEVTFWAERDENMVGIYLPPMPAGGRHLDCPDFFPLYQRAQELDLPFTVHIGIARPPYMPGTVDMDGRSLLLRSLSAPWGGMAAMGALIGGGVFDRFPTLRIGLFETHTGWMPFAVEQFENNARRSPAHVPHMHTPFREVIASGRYFHSIETGEEELRHAMDVFGDEIFLFSTDFPHRGTSWPNGVQEAIEPEWMSEASKRKILGENALRMFTRIKRPSMVVAG